MIESPLKFKNLNPEQVFLELVKRFPKMGKKGGHVSMVMR